MTLGADCHLNLNLRKIRLFLNFLDDRLSAMDRPERVGYQTSPHAPNTPENNVCKLVEYRSAKVSETTFHALRYDLLVLVNIAWATQSYLFRDLAVMNQCFLL